MQIHIKPFDTTFFLHIETAVMICLSMHNIFCANITILFHFDYTIVSKNMMEA